MKLQSIGEWTLRLYIANAHIWSCFIVRVFDTAGRYIPSVRKVDEDANDAFNSKIERWFAMLLMLVVPGLSVAHWLNPWTYAWLGLFLFGPAIVFLVICLVEIPVAYVRGGFRPLVIKNSRGKVF